MQNLAAKVVALERCTCNEFVLKGSQNYIVVFECICGHYLLIYAVDIGFCDYRILRLIFANSNKNSITTQVTLSNSVTFCGF